MIDPKDAQQLASVLLLSPQTGEPMRCCSPMKVNPDGTFSFDAENQATGEHYRITVRVEEIPYPEKVLR